MPKHFFFDLDNTLTRSKSLIEPAHADILRLLTDRADVVVVSGHDEGSIKKHLGEKVAGRYYILSQNGNYAEDPTGVVIWKKNLTEAQVQAAHRFAQQVRARFSEPVKDENDLVDDRGCQVAISLIGHHEKIEVKEAFDAGGIKRKKLLDDMPEEVAALENAGLEAKIGGTTVLDIIQKGKTKGFNIIEFLAKMDWKKEDCIYIGDALYPGGNDETVIGIIPTHAVADYQATYEYLQKVLSS